jgi:hydroxypyruvate reductase
MIVPTHHTEHSSGGGAPAESGATDPGQETAAPDRATPRDPGIAEDPAGFLSGLFGAMVAAADPRQLVPGKLPDPPPGRTLVIGAGKAAAAMAKTVEEHWPGPLSGIVVTRYGHGLPCRFIEVIEAGHPLPDSKGSEAAERILALGRGLSPDDLVLVLLSGGGSALLTLPAPGLGLADLRETNRQLLASGAPIGDVNCLRRHLSAIAGGRLALACRPAQVITFAISDVPGDDPAVIASGPTVADPSTFADALDVVERYHLDLPAAVLRHLQEAREETPKPGDPRLSQSRFVLLTSPACALEAAASAARAAGVEPLVLGVEIQGEVREVAAQHAALLRRLQEKVAATDTRLDGGRPILILSGGETSVTVAGRGRGGRNTEYLLALALAIEECGLGGSALYALAADTDGVDGSEDNAGAYLFPDTLARARAAGLDPLRALANNDSYTFFAAVDGLLVTGPTRTNVNDFRAILAL